MSRGGPRLCGLYVRVCHVKVSMVSSRIRKLITLLALAEPLHRAQTKVSVTYVHRTLVGRYDNASKLRFAAGEVQYGCLL